MYKLLVILFIIKLYVRNNIFKHIKKKHGQDIITIIRSFETLKTKYMKIQADITFIKSCKREKLIPTFANVKLSLKKASRKLKLRLARIMMESEMQNKHQEKKQVKKKIT